MHNKIFWFFETSVLRILSYLVPKRGNLILFGSAKWNYIWWNPKIYYLYLQKFWPQDLDIRFFSPSSDDDRFVTYGSSKLKTRRLILRAKYLIIDSCSFDLWIKGVIVGNFFVIQMRHWEPIKKIWFLSDLYIQQRNKLVLFFEKLEYKTYKMILSNVWTKEIIAWTFRNDAVYNIWVPRNDILRSQNILDLVKNNDVESQVSQWRKNFDKIILFSPTFREKNSTDYFESSELLALNRALQQQNILLVIKTHINESRKFVWEDEYSNIWDITKKLFYDSTDFQPFVDAIMTDFSSIYIDFLLTGKPVLFLQKDLDDYIHRERWLLYDIADVTTALTRVESVSSLISVIDDYSKIVNSSAYKDQYKKLSQKFYGTLEDWYLVCESLTSLLFYS